MSLDAVAPTDETRSVRLPELVGLRLTGLLLRRCLLLRRRCVRLPRRGATSHCSDNRADSRASAGAARDRADGRSTSGA
jgi:hypothetical protein